MKKLFAFAVIALLFTACRTQKSDKEMITVSVLPQKYFIEAIAGNDFDINVMVPSGASPASYEPSPEQMLKLQSSPLYFRIGHIGFEKAWMKNISSNHPEMKIIDLSEGLNLIEIPTEKHGDHYHYGVDPHIWLSPRLVKEFSPKILAALSELKKENSQKYQENYQKLITKIDSLDTRIKEWSAKAHNKSFLIFHPVLTYYARDYGYEQIPLEVDGKEPGLKHMKKIADQAQQKNIRKILVQKEFDMRNAKVTAEQIGGKIIQIDPLSENWPDNIIDISKKLAQE